MAGRGPQIFLTVSARLVGTISISAGQRVVIKAMFYLIVGVAVIGLVVAGALLYAFGALSIGTRVSKTVADGSIYITILVLAIIINIAIASPALLLLQPLHLRHVLRAERTARTPRQRFRGRSIALSSISDSVVDLRVQLHTPGRTIRCLRSLAVS